MSKDISSLPLILTVTELPFESFSPSVVPFTFVGRYPAGVSNLTV